MHQKSCHILSKNISLSVWAIVATTTTKMMNRIGVDGHSDRHDIPDDWRQNIVIQFEINQIPSLVLAAHFAPEYYDFEQFIKFKRESSSFAFGAVAFRRIVRIPKFKSITKNEKENIVDDDDERQTCTELKTKMKNTE